jgi:MacB-like protein
MKTLPLSAAVLALGVTLSSCVGQQTSFRAPSPDSYSPKRLDVVIDGAGSTQVDGAEVTVEFFRGAEVRPIIGRLLIDPEYESSALPVVILSYRCWQQRFGSTPAVIGKRVTIDGSPITIVGVAPPGFDVPKGTCFWLPRHSR